MDAGCKAKNWMINEEGFAYAFEWIPNGQLLEDGACVGNDYNNHSLPLNEKRTVYITIEYQRVRDVDDKFELFFGQVILLIQKSGRAWVADLGRGGLIGDLFSYGFCLGTDATTTVLLRSSLHR